jgi:hypothetical protein
MPPKSAKAHAWPFTLNAAHAIARSAVAERACGGERRPDQGNDREPDEGFNLSAEDEPDDAHVHCWPQHALRSPKPSSVPSNERRSRGDTASRWKGRLWVRAA